MVCPCLYPIVVSKNGIDFISFPLDDFSESDVVQIPLITMEEHDGKNWVVVQWKKDEHKDVKSYMINGHIVNSGCSEEDLQCDTKSVYSVYHPYNEWIEEHVIKVV